MIRLRSLCVYSLAVGSLAGTAGAQTAAYSSSPASAVLSAAGTSVQYGSSVVLGEGRARAYIVADDKGAPKEIGIALDERALDGLPAAGTGHHGGHVMPHTSLLEFPKANGTPFKFLEMNWNPSGHEPEGVYQGVPHFDFHFYTISQAQRDSILPTTPNFAARANAVPTGDYVPAFNVALGPPGATPAELAVPQMGVHWVDVRSPELQALLGKPDAYKPFTTTFIHGSWDGQFTFYEPMISRAHIIEKKKTIDPAVRDQVIPIPVPAKYKTAGYYPTAYRITWDAAAKEYRIALTDLTLRK
ncbi:MAG: DUF5602 domain-containing protein [Gemmatimonadaceae bacterium]